MRPTKTAIMIGLLPVALLGAYWAVGHAQERPPLFAPPSVLPPVEMAAPVAPVPEKKAPVKYPYQMQPLPKKTQADPSLIIPAAVYELPRPVVSDPIAPPRAEVRKAIVDQTAGIAQVGGVLQPPLPLEGGTTVPPPMFPALPTPAPLEEKTLEMPPPLRAPEPTKALILDAPAKPAASVGIASPGPLTPSQPPALLFPPPDERPAAQVRPIPTTPRAFVRIQSEDNRVLTRPLPSMPSPLTEVNPLPQGARTLPPLGVEPVGANVSNLQTPTVTVEKRGPATVRVGETVTYQLVVRNLGPVTAQQIRVEDDFPQDARFISAEPLPILQNNKALWTLAALPANQEQVLRLTVQAASAMPGAHHTSIQVGASNQAKTVSALRPQNLTNALAMQLIAPTEASVGQPVVFEIRVSNQSEQPLTGIVLRGSLPQGLDTPKGREIEGEVNGTLRPGETKTLRMPANAVQPGRFTVAAKVTTQAGQEASAQTTIDVTGGTLQVQQAASTRLFVGREGDLRIEVANHTGQPMRNVAIADRLPEGIDYLLASERGLYQTNSRTVHWLLDSLPAGATRTLALRVQGSKAGQYPNIVTAKADGVAEVQSTGAITMQAISDLTLRVKDQDHLLEVGRETVYEIQVQNPGNAAANNVRVQVQFPPGLTPKSAEGDTKFAVDRQTIIFEPIASLGPQEKAVYRVSARADATGDQRVQFAVVSEQVQVPIQREISTLVYRD